jgi:hypothetical protein
MELWFQELRFGKPDENCWNKEHSGKRKGFSIKRQGCAYFPNMITDGPSGAEIISNLLQVFTVTGQEHSRQADCFFSLGESFMAFPPKAVFCQPYLETSHEIVDERDCAADEDPGVRSLVARFSQTTYPDRQSWESALTVPCNYPDPEHASAPSQLFAAEADTEEYPGIIGQDLREDSAEKPLLGDVPVFDASLRREGLRGHRGRSIDSKCNRRA